MPKSVSELVRLSIESFAEFLSLNNHITMVQKHSDALEIIKATGFNISKINPKHLASALSEEGATMSFLSTPDPAKSHKETVKANPASNVDLDVARTILDNLEKTAKESQLARAQENTEEFKKGLGMIPDVEE